MLNSIESLRKDQKILANKLIQFNEAFKSSMEKVKKKRIEDDAAYQTEIKDVKDILDVHNDGIEFLEKEKSKLDTLIKKIDDKIDDVNKNIHEAVIKIEKLESNNNDIEIKQCIHDRKGYCREGERCKFFHTKEICTEHKENGICIRKSCRKRHPQHCRYFQRSICRREESCKYLHDKRRQYKNCDRCKLSSFNQYYCEFCAKSFCSRCTIKDAHLNNIFDGSQDQVSCQDIHNLLEQ